MSQVARSRIGVVTQLAPPGPLTDKQAVSELGAMFNACIEAAEVDLVLDFGNVSLINSVALEVLLDAQDSVTRVGGGLKIVHANTAIADVLTLTEVNRYITLENSAASATQGIESSLAQSQKLGALLIERGLVTEEVIAQAVELQATTSRRLGQILVDKEWLSEHDLLTVLSAQLALAFVKLRTGLFDSDVLCLINTETAKSLKVAPLFKVRGTIYLATSDPQNIPSIDRVEELTGCKVKPVLASRKDIVATISEGGSEDHDLSEYIGELDTEGDLELIEQQSSDDYATIDEKASGSPIINLVNGLIQRAVRDGASDIHIEPSRTRCRVRFRIDGVLYQSMTPPIEVHPALVSRLKVMANLDIAERRLPQDGRIQIYTHGRTIDLRFSSLPGIFGEKVVLRVLDRGKSILDVEKLGMSDANLDTFKQLLRRSYGLILVTGPTGSGKTTTLYAAINHLSSVEQSIVTIEDPVEYQLDLINQNQVKETIGLSFAKVLKHVLRQDPDIIMVGEIREPETAEIAVQAALTGHLVLSTLHTNDSAGAITRLLDMGVEPFLLSSALIGVMAQRLVRTVCPGCKTSYAAPPGSLERYGLDESKTIRLNRGRGCPACYDSGYRGRIAIHELLDCDSATQQLMLSNPSRDSLAEHLSSRGIKTLLDDGVAQAINGATTIEEVSRVVNA